MINNFPVQKQLISPRKRDRMRLFPLFSGDIGCLSDLDYILEEKREQIDGKIPDAKVEDSSDDDDKAEVDPRKIPDTIGKAPGQGRTKEVSCLLFIGIILIVVIIWN